MPTTHERNKPKTQQKTQPKTQQKTQPKTQQKTQTRPTSQKRVLYKINILGDSGVGKSSYVQRCALGTFQDRYRSTIGADFLTKTINNTQTNKDIVLQLWDTAGRERFSGLGFSFLRGSDGLFILYDITVKQTFEHVVGHYEEYKAHGYVDNPKVVLIGTKLDKNDTRQVSTKQGEELAKALGISFLEISTKENTNMDKSIELLLDEIHKKANEDAVIDEEDAVIDDLKLENSQGWLSSFWSWLWPSKA